MGFWLRQPFFLTYIFIIRHQCFCLFVQFPFSKQNLYNLTKQLQRPFPTELSLWAWVRNGVPKRNYILTRKNKTINVFSTVKQFKMGMQNVQKLEPDFEFHFQLRDMGAFLFPYVPMQKPYICNETCHTFHIRADQKYGDPLPLNSGKSLSMHCWLQCHWLYWCQKFFFFFSSRQPTS